jgi:hypothetical protein
MAGECGEPIRATPTEPGDRDAASNRHGEADENDRSSGRANDSP